MIRNTLFSFFFFTGIVVISILFLPSLMFPQKIVLFGGKLFGYWSSFCLKFFLSTKIVIKGAENIIRNEKFFLPYIYVKNILIKKLLALMKKKMIDEQFYQS